MARFLYKRNIKVDNYLLHSYKKNHFKNAYLQKKKWNFDFVSSSHSGQEQVFMSYSAECQDRTTAR